MALNHHLHNHINAAHGWFEESCPRCMYLYGLPRPSDITATEEGVVTYV